MNRPASIIPKKDQWFNAIVRGYGHVARGCPCKCTGITNRKSANKVVNAVDSAGDKWKFNQNDFEFKLIERKKSC